MKQLANGMMAVGAMLTVVAMVAILMLGMCGFFDREGTTRLPYQISEEGR